MPPECCPAQGGGEAGAGVIASPAQSTPRQGTMAARGWPQGVAGAKTRGLPPTGPGEEAGGAGSGRAQGSGEPWSGSVSKTTWGTCWERRPIAAGAPWKVTGPHAAQTADRVLLLAVLTPQPNDRGVPRQRRRARG